MKTIIESDYACIQRLESALRDLLELPEAKRQLAYLDKGIGTKTREAAWLRARDALGVGGNDGC